MTTEERLLHGALQEYLETLEGAAESVVALTSAAFTAGQLSVFAAFARAQVEGEGSTSPDAWQAAAHTLSLKALVAMVAVNAKLAADAAHTKEKYDASHN